MIFEKTSIEGVLLITPQIREDSRGFFMETYKESTFLKYGIPPFVQDNHSKSSKNVLRGLHFQIAPKPQGKLVRCIQGAIFDVAVDLNPHSKTYKQWVGFELSADNKKMLWIPEGNAHGFLTLSDSAEIVYKCTNEYQHSLDAGISWNDPEINVNWGIKDPQLSEKDKNLKPLKVLIEQGIKII